MVKIYKLLLFVICFLLIVFPVFAVNYPSPSGFVNDFAGIYSKGFKDNLEVSLSNFEKETGAEIAVATIKSLDGMDIETYALELFAKWKVGKKEQLRGKILLARYVYLWYYNKNIFKG